jgi:ligand-binding SRPBCC domain-containing protein
VPTIELTTFIKAAPEVCFDLSRNIDVHADSTSRTRERAVAGVTSGLIGFGQEVTWEAVHFGVRQRFTSRITEYQRPGRFVDEMTQGAFKRFRHVHEFQPRQGGTLMVDRVEFQSPLGPLGRLADILFLKSYLRRLLTGRNLHIKALAESGSRISQEGDQA